ncbi:MAG TPA: zf-HC2 domain-containing protein [Phycisphaerae bacterium]|nr:zf-HC2 domain-containing protein [Phycisphaerae bacterium]
MNDQRETYEQLLSERADGELTSEQRADLERALASDADLARQAGAYQGLHALLDAWRAVPSDIDWQNLSARISREVGEEAALVAVEPIDNLVSRAHGPIPDVDWPQLQSRISAAVRADAAAGHGAGTGLTRRSWSRMAKRIVAIGAPLAAAAAIALALWLPRTSSPVAPTGPTPTKAMIVVSYETPQPAGKVKVAFEEKPYTGPDTEAVSNGAAIANGPSRAFPRERVEETVLY